ncbi:hypothetical protein ACQPXS_08620 [Streptomyces sp. CA-142005]|uniref:hypothetical protein n=1 Tax=Streptomyces sp. CA-142005 TaxID=3240052 RepID=UPI003D8E6558
MTHVIADDTGPAPTEAPRFDGFDLAYVTTPGSFADFVDLVVPELGSRGRIAALSGGATLRERLHGAASSSRIRDDHPAARHRELAIRERESAGTHQLRHLVRVAVQPGAGHALQAAAGLALRGVSHHRRLPVLVPC